MSRHSGSGSHGPYFVIRYNGSLYVVSENYVYDPDDLAPSPEEAAAIAYLEAELGGGDIAILDESVLVQVPDNGKKVEPPPPPPPGC